MFKTAVIVILALLTVASFILASVSPTENTDKYSDIKNPKRFSFLVSFGLLAFTVIVTFFSTFTIVRATEVAVPVAFGHVSDPLRSGVHFVAPWINVETYPTRPVTIELSGNNKILARTADAGQMTVEIAARWRVEPDKAKQLYLQVRTGDDERISQDIVVKNLRQAVGQVYSLTGNLDALNDRVKTTEAIMAQMVVQLKKYGITIEDINLRSVEPDQKTANTISQYASQQQATRIAEEAKKTAQIEAERRLIEAQGLKAASKATAGMSSAELQTICMQIWQQVVTRGIDNDMPVYTNPCANTGSIIVNGK